MNDFENSIDRSDSLYGLCFNRSVGWLLPLVNSMRKYSLTASSMFAGSQAVFQLSKKLSGTGYKRIKSFM